jgi:hypothetical protein
VTEIAFAGKIAVVMKTERPVDWPPLFNAPPAYSYGPTLGVYLDAAAFYAPPKRWTASNSKPSAIIETRRRVKGMKGRARVAEINPQLTKDYLGGTPGWLHEFYSVLVERATLKFLAARGTIQQCRAEKTAAQLNTKMGRPPIGERAMTNAERKRRERNKTHPPQMRSRPGTVKPPPQGPTVPGSNLIIERNEMLLDQMARQSRKLDEILRRLDDVLARLKSAAPDHVLTRDELEVIADAAGRYRRSVH